MKKPNFIHWYYNEAVCDLLEIWKNFLFFAWQHFSISELTKTLLSPWRRDVVFSTWVGIHPIKMLTALFENIVSRFLGAIVRTFVISAGLAFFLLVLVFGLAINIIWLGAPLLLVVFFFYAFNLGIDFYYSIGLALVWIVGAAFLYYQDSKPPMLLMNFQHLLRHSVFERICGRLDRKSVV